MSAADRLGGLSHVQNGGDAAQTTGAVRAGERTAGGRIRLMNSPEPVAFLMIEPKTNADQERLSQGLRKLAAEDPTLRVSADKQSGATIIRGMEDLQLEIVVERLQREFSVEAAAGDPQVAYK